MIALGKTDEKKPSTRRPSSKRKSFDDDPIKDNDENIDTENLAPKKEEKDSAKSVSKKLRVDGDDKKMKSQPKHSTTLLKKEISNCPQTIDSSSDAKISRAPTSSPLTSFMSGSMLKRSPGIFRIFNQTPESKSEVGNKKEDSVVPTSVRTGTTTGPGLRKPSIRKTRKSLIQSPKESKIKILFDSIFSISDGLVNDIIAAKLKSSSKWDFKDKAQRQALVISELKALFATTFEQVEALRQNCMRTEQSLNDALRESMADIQTHVQQIEGLKDSELAVKKDMARLNNELSKSKSLLTQAHSVEASLKESLMEKCREFTILKERALIDETNRQKAEAEIEWFRNQLQIQKKEFLDNLAAVNAQCDQVNFPSSTLTISFFPFVPIFPHLLHIST